MNVFKVNNEKNVEKIDGDFCKSFKTINNNARAESFLVNLKRK